MFQLIREFLNLFENKTYEFANNNSNNSHKQNRTNNNSNGTKIKHHLDHHDLNHQQQTTQQHNVNGDEYDLDRLSQKLSSIVTLNVTSPISVQPLPTSTSPLSPSKFSTKCSKFHLDGKDSVDFAIVLDSIAFSYNKNNPVLRDVSINVPKGQIYALLGSNGCGKTTLLNILLSRIKVHKGSVKIFGQNPGSTLNHIIGYMPQELGLNPLLHIEDTFYYFAQVNHIKNRKLVQEQIKNYMDILDIHDSKQRVIDLSGGQKRLLSLGVTLIYQPKILLLDEPTVGIDSLIRSKIWTHLRNLCHLNQTTVLITTHYIDEAKESNMVGFLNEGQMLAEDSPGHLMHHLSCRTLEEVFLKLCFWNIQSNNKVEKDQVISSPSSNSLASESLADKILFKYKNGRIDSRRSSCSLNIGGEDHHDVTSSIDRNNNSNNNNDLNKLKKSIDETGDYHRYQLTTGEKSFHLAKNDLNQHHGQTALVVPCSRYYLNFDHICALMSREWFFFKHNISLFLFFVFIPLLTVFLFKSSYGRTPNNVPVAVYNEETDWNTPGFDKPLSKVFLEEFDDSMVNLNWFDSEDAAHRSVVAGQNMLAIAFRQNFSSSLIDRYYKFDLKKVPSSDGSLHMYIDNSRLINLRYVNRSILLAFRKTIERFGSTQGMNPNIFSLPIQTEEIIYGSIEPHFEDLFLAGIIIITLLSMNAVKAAFELIFLYQNGCLKRDLNQGVRPIEILLTFIISSFGSIFWQSLTTSAFAFYLLDVELQGNFFTAFFLLFITTCQGLFIGTFFSVLFPDQIMSMLFVFTALVVMFFTSGTLWPLEGMSSNLQRLFLANPIVLPIQSMRLVMLRGWSILNRQVFMGYVFSGGVCFLMFVISSLMFHYFNNTIH